MREQRNDLNPSMGRMTRLTEDDLLNEVIQIFVVLPSVFFFMAQIERMTSTWSH
jgi:hypothetical protein